MKVFVNRVDSTLGGLLAKRLLERPPAGEDEEEVVDISPIEVVGSLSADPNARAPSWVSSVVSTADRASFVAATADCDSFIFDISQDPAEASLATWTAQYYKERLEDILKPRTICCVSSVLTWASTKPADPDAEEVAPLVEDEFRRRRAHRSYRTLLDAEKTITKCGKKTDGKLFTSVICAGLVYGRGETALHSLFRRAWEMNEESLPVYGGGANYIPTIHVDDLASTVIDTVRSGSGGQYIVAVDESKHTLREIAECISKNLGPGKIHDATLEEGLLDPFSSQSEFDLLSINQQFDQGSIAEMEFEWHSAEGLIANIRKVIREFKAARHLNPLRIILHGPPAVGKTTLARFLSQHYKLPYVSVQSATEDKIKALRASAARIENGEDDLEESEVEQARFDADELAAIEQELQDSGTHDLSQTISWLREKLLSMSCLNQGYVLDGVPGDEEQLKQLMARGDEDELEEGDDEVADSDGPSPRLAPDFVILLDAPDAYLTDRVLSLPEQEVAGTRNTESEYPSRLAKWRAENTDERTVLNYFDLHEIHPMTIDVQGLSLDLVQRQLLDVAGAPRNYGPSPEEAAALEAERAAREEAEQAVREKEEAAARAIEEERAGAAQAEWSAKRDTVMREQQQALDEASLPLRTFLMRHVMPTLTQGLLEVCKTKPEDPIDFLAEYLFQNNPQID
ncbi:uncharacterized protein MONBRDRAFT_32804 [Monosiga brevicollis MX1]|uniref:ATPase AAA-type core domain-containing protein n=1 Tax=Monosiga brevicollis TaxID=81824 RepID=A9V1U0_MONBE|nr:uncharacterized protein MONBRDRAFT_32804 [Monosiga brevicollis MX1]EDQ88502.1 predicted protein [Monosiga brevicollis MX1]|eukprot:XP_001746606.1 hypothetical protein [Monosiga brevicollis MX1]